MDYSQELIMPDQDLPFKMFLFEGMKGDYFRERHWHREIEIFAVFQGALTFHLAGEEAPLREGEFMLVNSNELHSIAAPDPNMTLVFQFPVELFSAHLNEDGIIYFSHDAQERDEEIMGLLRTMYETYSRRREGCEFQVLSHFYRLLYLLLSRYRRRESLGELAVVNRNLNRLSRITAYMRDHFGQELTLEAVARTFSYSPTYVSHMFQKYARTTFRSYLTSIRLEHAHRQIAETDLALSQIAMDTGFASSKALAHAFSAKFGILPSDYRKRIPGS